MGGRRRKLFGVEMNNHVLCSRGRRLKITWDLNRSASKGQFTATMERKGERTNAQLNIFDSSIEEVYLQRAQFAEGLSNYWGTFTVAILGFFCWPCSFTACCNWLSKWSSNVLPSSQTFKRELKAKEPVIMSALDTVHLFLADQSIRGPESHLSTPKGNFRNPIVIG